MTDIHKPPRNTSIDLIQVDTFNEDDGGVLVNIIPRGDKHWRIFVRQRKRFVDTGWITTIQWNSGRDDIDNPDSAKAWVEAMNVALEVRERLRAIHPDEIFS